MICMSPNDVPVTVITEQSSHFSGLVIVIDGKFFCKIGTMSFTNFAAASLSTKEMFVLHKPDAVRSTKVAISCLLLFSQGFL